MQIRVDDHKRRLYDEDAAALRDFAAEMRPVLAHDAPSERE
jgi:hypothetical protein